MIALARKYRPKQFADLLVQDHVAAALRGAVAQGRVAHGYLFAGPRGVGKTTAARILAMALNCERRRPDGEPCGECDSCRRVWTGQANLDVVELDAASNRGVDDARDLRERAMYAASAEGRSKVYIVDEAHMLTRDAWNALLKILEEPPPRVVFVFATTEPQKIAQSAAPVLSRLQRFDFRRIGPHAIASRLRQVATAEGIAAEDDALALIAKSADGGMRDGLSLLDQVVSFGSGAVTPDRVRQVLGLIPDELYGELLRLVVAREPAAVFPLVDQLAEAGADFIEFAAGAAEVMRAVLQAGLGGDPEGLTEGMQAIVRGAVTQLSPPDVVRLLSVLGTMEQQIRQSGNPRFAVELLLLRWAMMDRTVELAQVLSALGDAGKREGGSGKGAPPVGKGAPPVMKDVTPVGITPNTPRPASSAPPEPPVSRPSSQVPEKGPLTLDRLRSLWSNIVEHARSTSPLIGSLLAETEVVAVENATVTLAPRAHGATSNDGIEHKRDAIAKLVSDWAVDGPRVRIAVRAREQSAATPRPVRMTEQSANAERLKVLQAKDPTLGAAVDALDLELLE